MDKKQNPVKKIVKTVWVKSIRYETSCGQSKSEGDSMKGILRSKRVVIIIEP